MKENFTDYIFDTSLLGVDSSSDEIKLYCSLLYMSGSWRNLEDLLDKYNQVSRVIDSQIVALKIRALVELNKVGAAKKLYRQTGLSPSCWPQKIVDKLE